MLQPTAFYHGARGSMAATDYKHAIKPPIITAVCSDETYWFTRRQLRQMIDLRGAGRSTLVACQGGWQQMGYTLRLYARKVRMQVLRHAHCRARFLIVSVSSSHGLANVWTVQ